MTQTKYQAIGSNYQLSQRVTEYNTVITTINGVDLDGGSKVKVMGDAGKPYILTLTTTYPGRTNFDGVFEENKDEDGNYVVAGWRIATGFGQIFEHIEWSKLVAYQRKGERGRGSYSPFPTIQEERKAPDQYLSGKEPIYYEPLPMFEEEQ